MVSAGKQFRSLKNFRTRARWLSLLPHVRLEFRAPLTTQGESLSQAHALAKQRQLATDYYKGCAVNLEAKATQTTRAQLAMQLQLEEVHQNQESILGELDGADWRLRRISSGDSESAALKRCSMV